MNEHGESTRSQVHRCGRSTGWALLLALLVALFAARTFAAAAGPGDPQPAAGEAALTRQFEETSYYLKDVDMISADVGWAVGAPHWDQSVKAYVGTILKTVDGGVTWSPQTANTTATLLNVDSVGASSAWAVGTGGTILHTADGGAHWTQQPVASGDEFRGVAFVSPTQGWATSFHATHYDSSGEADNWRGTVWHTADGVTWQAQTLPANAGLLNRVKFLDAQCGWVVGVKHTGDDRYGRPQHAGVVYATANGGQSWEELYSPGADITLTGVEWVDAMHGWVVGFPNLSSVAGGFVFHTADGGQTWQQQTPGGIYDPLWDVHFIDANRGYTVGFNYIAAWGPPVFRTVDGGATWEKVKMAQQENEGLFAVSVIGDQVIALGDHDFVVRSTNAWGSCTPPPYYGECLFAQAYLNTHYVFHDVFFADGDHGWAVGSRSYRPKVWGQAILHTSDGGLTWASQYEMAPPADSTFSYLRLDSVSFADAQQGWAVGSSELFGEPGQREYHNAILHTTDGGQHWQEQGRELYASWGLEFFSVQSLDEQTGWALAAKNFPNDDIFLAHTVDGGDHWSWVDTAITGTLQVGYGTVMGSVFFTDAQHGWAAGGLSQVVQTSDGGAHWSRANLSCGAHPCYYTVLGVAFADDRNGWLVGQGMFHSQDGGATWVHQDLAMGSEMQDIEFAGGGMGCLVNDLGEIWCTGSGGARWQLLESGTGFALRGLDVLDARRAWFVGDGGTILRYSADHPPVVEVFLPVVRR